MIKNKTIALILSAGIALTGCEQSNDNGIKRTSDGLMYRIVKDEPGELHPQIKDNVKMHVNIRIGDSVMLNSRKMNGNNPFEFPLMEGTFKSDWVNGVSLLTAGDSAIFYVPVDTAKKYAQGQFPAFAKSEDTVTYEVFLVSFESANAQLEKDDEQLQTYFQENNLNPQKTESGLYYIIEKEGNGANIERGQKVTVNYTGQTLAGEKFDSNVDPDFRHVEPFIFAAGVGQVIHGWDEGILLLKKGSKARFFIPSPLAYGASGKGPKIGPNSILIFDVEITDVAEMDEAPVQ